MSPVIRLVIVVALCVMWFFAGMAVERARHHDKFSGVRDRCKAEIAAGHYVERYPGIDPGIMLDECVKYAQGEGG